MIPLTPTKVLNFIKRYIKQGFIFSWLVLGVGLFFTFYLSPPDIVQGETVRIMYIHVPCAWGALMTYFAMACCSLYAFWQQTPLLHYITRSMAPVGTLLCGLSLITGAIWGKPTWGTWWVWDARLTSMLILFLLYFGYTFTVKYLKPESQALKIGAFISLVGALNLPVIKWSVNWWNTLHQPASIMRLAKPALDKAFLWPLGIMCLGLFCLCLCLFFLNLYHHLKTRKGLTKGKRYS